LKDNSQTVTFTCVA